MNTYIFNPEDMCLLIRHTYCKLIRHTYCKLYSKERALENVAYLKL